MSVFRMGTLTDLQMDVLGEAVLKDSLRLASKAFLRAVTPTYQAQEIHEALVFLNGSGLDYFLVEYGLDLDAQRLRETFQWHIHWVQHHGTAGELHHLPSSGAPHRPVPPESGGTSV